MNATDVAQVGSATTKGFPPAGGRYGRRVCGGSWGQFCRENETEVREESVWRIMGAVL